MRFYYFCFPLLVKMILPLGSWTWITQCRATMWVAYFFVLYLSNVFKRGPNNYFLFLLFLRNTNNCSNVCFAGQNSKICYAALNKCICTQPSLSKEINLKGSQRIDATVTCVFHESIYGSNCRRPAEQTWQTRQHQQQVVCLCALCLNLTACQLPLRGTMLFIIYTICYAVYMCLHSQWLNIENQKTQNDTKQVVSRSD